jgi:uncharacterized lipoprotein
MLALGIAAGCSREPTRNCEPNERYSTARSTGPVQVPDDLSPPDERDALRLPDPAVSAAPVATDACLETPPPFSEQRPGRRGAAPTPEPADAVDEPAADPDRVIGN